MIKTQVRIPEELYRETKRVAEEYEMSFAEVLRRGLERTRPACPLKQRAWQPPVPLELGIRAGLGDDEWRLLANEPDYVPRRQRKRRP